MWLLIIILVILAALLLYFRIPIIKFGGGDTKDIILCVPGLGDGAESYDWPRVDQSIPAKIGVYSSRSLKAELSMLGYDVRTFDQPDDPGRTIADYCDWIEQNVLHGQRPDIVIGHSGGAHVANYYAKTRGARGAILVDPTPEFVYKTAREYKRHVEKPDELRYAKTAKYLWMYSEDPTQSIFNVDTHRVVVYSIDDTDKRREEKEHGMKAISAAKHIVVPNGTHWVHVTNPDKIIEAISAL